jgi:hypothetical protein
MCVGDQRPAHGQAEGSVVLQLKYGGEACFEDVEEDIGVLRLVIDVLAAENNDLHGVEYDADGLLREDIVILIEHIEHLPTVLLDVILLYLLP